MGAEGGEGALVDLSRRGRRRTRTWVRRMGVAAVLLGVGFVALGFVWRVGSIRVEGAERLAPETVLREARLSGGERILLTRLGVVERRVEGLPAIRDATVRRRLPSTVVITVREREPVARLGGTEDLYAGEDGVVFEARSSTPLPVLVGWKGDARPGARLAEPAGRVLSAFAGFPAILREGTMRIELGDQLTLAVGEETEIRFGEPVEVEAKGAAAAAVLREAGSRGEQPAYVDVRSPRAPVTRDRQPSPDPEGSPPPSTDESGP